jgi:hypothetical protein
MTIDVLSKTRDPAAPYCYVADSVERILKDMSEHTLDPTFEDHGDFVDRNPEWDDPSIAKKYAGCTVIWGNFWDYSGVFNIITDDQSLIDRISEAVKNNKQRPEYAAARKEVERLRREERERMVKEHEKRVELARIIYGH